MAKKTLSGVRQAFRFLFLFSTYCFESVQNMASSYGFFGLFENKVEQLEKSKTSRKLSQFSTAALIPTFAKETFLFDFFDIESIL